MSLQSILDGMPDVENLTEEVIISPRFVDENGEAVKFRIRAMTQADFSRIKRANSVVDKKGVSTLNEANFHSQIVVEHCIEPSFKNSESISRAGCATPVELVNKKLTSGEILALSNAISNLSGFGIDIDALNEEIKNS